MTRRGLVLLGLALLVPMGIAAVLWWVIFDHPDWIRHLPDKTGLIDRTVKSIYQARLRVPSADADENGMPDWYEAAWGRNPHRAFTGMVRVPNFFLYRGERTPLHLVYDIALGFPDVRWPIDMEVTIKATKPILLAADAPAGTPPTTGPLRVKLSKQGRLDFDVLMFDDQNDGVEITHARSGISLTDGRQWMFRAHGWRLAVQPSRVLPLLDGTFDAGPAAMNGLPSPSRTGPILIWEPHPDPRVSYILEAARPDTPNEWLGFDLIGRSDAYEKLLGDEYLYVFRNYTGPLLYRVIAISDRRPAVVE